MQIGIIWYLYWFEYIYGQDMRNHYIHMIIIEVEVIKRIGQARVNEIWGIMNWLDHITISPYMLL
jgi:hypothetical protein